MLFGMRYVLVDVLECQVEMTRRASASGIEIEIPDEAEMKLESSFRCNNKNTFEKKFYGCFRYHGGVSHYGRRCNSLLGNGSINKNVAHPDNPESETQKSTSQTQPRQSGRRPFFYLCISIHLGPVLTSVDPWNLFGRDQRVS
jgi:hypothetical protein